MKLCIVGIGGCGGATAKEFLNNEDLSLQPMTFLIKSDYISVGGVKGLWLECDSGYAINKQDFFRNIHKNPNDYPGFFIPHDIIPFNHEVHRYVNDEYGYDIKKHGFWRDSQYYKAVYEIFETDPYLREIAERLLGYPNPIFEGAWNAIIPYTTLKNGNSEGILFIISLGGGTGSGFVNPIVNYIRRTGRGDYPVFVLGVLTEKGVYSENPCLELSDDPQFAPPERRELSAVSSIYDLVTNVNHIDGLIMVDNEVLMSKCEGDYIAVNRYLYKVMRPIIAERGYPGEMPGALAIKEIISAADQPPLLIPCYASLPKADNHENELVDKALSENGRLMECTPKKAEAAYVFCRGYLKSDEIKKAINDKTELSSGRIAISRKLGDGSHDEILILLRNPYGSLDLAEDGLGTRLYNLIKNAVKYIDTCRSRLLDLNEDEPSNQRKTEALNRYFYGENGFKSQLELAKGRLERGEKRIFFEPLNIFYGGNNHPPSPPSGGLGPFTPAQLAEIERIVQEKLNFYKQR